MDDHPYMDDEIPFFVRTTFRGDSQMISLDRNDISFENFKDKCEY